MDITQLIEVALDGLDGPGAVEETFLRGVDFQPVGDAWGMVHVGAVGDYPGVICHDPEASFLEMPLKIHLVDITQFRLHVLCQLPGDGLTYLFA